MIPMGAAYVATVPLPGTVSLPSPLPPPPSRLSTSTARLSPIVEAASVRPTIAHGQKARTAQLNDGRSSAIAATEAVAVSFELKKHTAHSTPQKVSPTLTTDTVSRDKPKHEDHSTTMRVTRLINCSNYGCGRVRVRVSVWMYVNWLCSGWRCTMRRGHTLRCLPVSAPVPFSLPTTTPHHANIHPTAAETAVLN